MASHVGHQPPVTVRGARRDLRPLLETQRCQVLTAGIAEGLAALRSVHRSKTHGHLLIVAWLTASSFQGVAVGDADDQANKGSCQRHYLRFPTLNDTPPLLL
ncbi:hypothetical protein AVMA1855_03795 [Acidovorax sp. SUPP1855]|nr:hypothetical protein AVMA1855_03795 [Acidovorax sp. SUPP1855]